MVRNFVYSNQLDVSEHTIWEEYPEILDILLIDHSSNKNIKWCTDTYKTHGFGFQENDYIRVDRIIGKYKGIIKPRVLKSLEECRYRIKDKAEVFTPSWMCNYQNNLIDNDWFGHKNNFNREDNKKWITTKKVLFKKNQNFVDYIKSQRIEITCGEAPYLVSRYDTTSGDFIETSKRIGLLDRKLRVISENVNNKSKWLNLALMAYKSIYGYDFQGDNVLLARENLLVTFIEFYSDKFHEKPPKDSIKDIANVISWNIWQMDGLKYVVPNSCHLQPSSQISLFGDESEEACEGCVKNDISKHNGIYCRVMDWECNKPVTFLSLILKKNRG